MTDYFALLAEPRRPWLEAESLKKKFLTQSAEVHPDKLQSASATGQFAEFNAAYNCLREPKERLRHLLELELQKKPTDLQQIPGDLADLFMQIGGLCRQVDGFLKEKAGATSPLLQAQLFERGQEWSDKLLAMQCGINERHELLIARVKLLDAEWVAQTENRRALLPQLEEAWRLLGFFTRWSNQIQERVTQLML